MDEPIYNMATLATPAIFATVSTAWHEFGYAFRYEFRYKFRYNQPLNQVKVNPMRMTVLALICTLFAGSALAITIPAGQTYRASVGNYTCTPTAPGETTVDESTEEGGGTLRLGDSPNQIKIEVRAFNPPLQSELALNIYRKEVMESFLYEKIINPMKKDKPKTAVLNKQEKKIGERKVFLAAMLVPGGLQQADGKTVDGMLVHIQDMNATYIYNISKMLPVPSGKDKAKKITQGLAEIEQAYSLCKFSDE
jgi:hypothetical protein